MTFPGFSTSDFNVFKINGLEDRMAALQERIRPKLEALGEHFSQELSIFTGQEMYSHVAKHARRTINPPKDTWVAFAGNRRGYKMLPHFQIGLWETHLFIWFAVIYEVPNKIEIGHAFEKNIKKIKKIIPNDFVWSGDHTVPDAIPHGELSLNELQNLFTRLQTVKKAEILCGYHISREEAIKLSAQNLENMINDVFAKLIPLYKLC